ncbi:MAG TPA: hypothetical protein VH684_13390, partial [Xanthobacteraceae bacterium]
ALARRAHASEALMSHYRRASIEGGLYFFTVTLADRSSDLLVRYIDRLRRIYRMIQQRQPFETIAICVLPDIWIGRTAASNITSRAEICRPTGAAMSVSSPAALESDRTRGHGAQARLCPPYRCQLVALP